MRIEALKYKRLRDLREDKDISQQEIAALLGVAQNTYSQYETNERNIPVELLCRLADYYQTSVDYLLGRTDVFAPYPKAQK